MSQLATVILMGSIVVGIGLLTVFLPLSEEEKTKLNEKRKTDWSDVES